MSIDSTQRSIVIAKSQDLADRIRSSGAAPNNYVQTYDSSICDTPPTDVCIATDSTSAISCNSVQMARFDVWDVFCASSADTDNRAGLNGGVSQWSTTVNCSANCGGAGAQMTIATTWVSRTADTDAEITDNNVTNADGSQASAVTDSLTLSFVR